MFAQLRSQPETRKNVRSAGFLFLVPGMRILLYLNENYC